MTVQSFKVGGMTCAHCARAVTQAVQAVDPGATIAVDLEGGRVTVAGSALAEQIAAAIVEEGYTVEKLAV